MASILSCVLLYFNSFISSDFCSAGMMLLFITSIKCSMFIVRYILWPHAAKI